MLIIWVFLGSVVGIALMVLLNQRLGLNTPAQIYSVEEAVKRLDADQVGFVPGGASVLADDHRSAIIEEAGTGRLGLLAARGDEQIEVNHLGGGCLLHSAARLPGCEDRAA